MPVIMTASQIKSASDGAIQFELTVTKTALDQAYQKALQELAKTAEIKGFRKGKAPLNLVEAQADKSKLLSHALEHALPPLYTEIITTNKLHPLIEPHITPKSMKEGEDWVFTVQTAGLPEFKLGDYQKYLKADLAAHDKAHPHDVKAKPEEIRDHKLGTIFDSLLKHTQVKVAKILVEEEAKSALSRLVNQLSSLKLKVEDYAKSIKKTTDELVVEYQKTATTNLQLEFILQAIIADLKPEVKETDPYKKYAAEKKAAIDFLSGL